MEYTLNLKKNLFFLATMSLLKVSVFATKRWIVWKITLQLQAFVWMLKQQKNAFCIFQYADTDSLNCQMTIGAKMPALNW